MIEFPLATLLTDRIELIQYEPELSDGNLFIAHMPASPDLAVMLMPTGGPAGSSTHGYDDWTTQVMVRGEIHDPDGPFNVASDIYDQLQGLHEVTLGTGTPHEVYLVGTFALQARPTLLDQDENERYRYTQNFRFHVRNQTTHRN